jgi:starch synthase (maltosyl-transferring)
MAAHPDRRSATPYDRILEVEVDREKARFSTWYELFPRSTAATAGAHGTFRDVEARLPYIAAMHFDVLYLPPIHPIGRSFRKGRNNSEHAERGDPGSPWAIGNEAGGHLSIHPELGTLADFRSLVRRARDYGLEVALDIAFQCSPDHPWVSEHPLWFRQRPDGTVQYAENPPKKYQDIYPLNFDSEDWRGLWQALKGVFEFWIDQGVSIFRVDNPHTKPLKFWGWVIGELKRAHPELLFLAEAFTRPKLMYALAKAGFSQSYTYFTWRTAKWELEQYFRELTESRVREFFRPNLWPNTPDILHAVLQEGGRPAFAMRYVLAATLGANIGIYGPVYELGENVPRAPGVEENRDNEKYEIHTWDLDAPHSLARFLGKVNGIRHAHPALQSDRGLTFHGADNESIIVYSKATEQRDDVILAIVNLDWRQAQESMVHLRLEALGLSEGVTFEVEDLLGGETYTWHGAHNYVKLDPMALPAHVLAVRRRGAGGTS